MPFEEISISEYIEKLRNEYPEFKKLWDSREIQKDFIKLGYSEEESEELAKYCLIQGAAVGSDSDAIKSE